MMRIEFKRSALQDLRKLDRRLVPNILQRIESLRGEPVPRQSVKLVGTEGLYRLRTGTYRVIYELDSEAELITIFYIRHRREAYRNL